MDDIQKSLEDSIEDASLSTITNTFLDIDIDEWQNVLGDLSNNEVVKNVPILKWLAALYSTSKTISTHLLMKKIARFLYQLKDIPIEERQSFLNKMNSKDRRKLLDNLILILEKHDNFTKSDILGKLFEAFIRGELTQEEFSKLNYATNLINVDSIKELLKFYGGDTILPVEVIYNFGFLQLISIDNSLLGTYGGGQPRYLGNSLGRKFVVMLSRMNP